MTRWEREGWGHSRRRSSSSEKHEACIESELKDGLILSCDEIKMPEKIKESCCILKDQHAWPGFIPTLPSSCYSQDLFFLFIHFCVLKQVGGQHRCQAKKIQIIEFSSQSKSRARHEICNDLKRCGHHIWSICCWCWWTTSFQPFVAFVPTIRRAQIMSSLNTS